MLRERTLSLILTVWPFRKQANPRRLYEPYHPCHGKPGTGKGVRRPRRHGRSGALPALPRCTMQRRLPGRNRSGPIHPLVAFLEPLGSGRDHPGKQSAGSELFPHLSGQRTVRRRLCPSRLDAPVKIAKLQRFITDEERRLDMHILEAGEPNGKTVACVGAGPLRWPVR